LNVLKRFFKTSGVALSKRLILSILITALIIFILLSQISLKDLYTLLKTVDPLWVSFGAAGYILAIFFRALRFKWLIHSKGVSLSELFRITVFHNLSIMVLPSKLGEFSYPYFLNKMSGLSMTEGLASLIASRVYDFLIVLMIFLFVSVGFQSFFKSSLFLIILLTASSFALIFLAFFYMSSLLKWVSDSFGKISKWRGATIKSFLWVQRKANEMAEDFYAIRARRTYLSVSLASLISWIMVFWMCYAFLRGFGIGISFFKAIFGSAAGLMASALPISGFGNWGTLEAGWAAGFLMVGLSKEKAITTGFGVHILVFTICTIISFFCWITLKKK
jgi:uncharacterized protein (TIRG00374 family)